MSFINDGLLDCDDCFTFLVKKPHKARETMVKVILDAANLTYVHDRIQPGGCNKYRPDFLFDYGTHIVILEVDEDQHRNYECACEQARMINLFQAQGGMKTLFIRFNPDSYIDRAGKRHVWTNSRGVKLIDVLRQTRDPPEHLISAVYLYYDQYDPNKIEFIPLNYGL